MTKVQTLFSASAISAAFLFSASIAAEDPTNSDAVPYEFAFAYSETELQSADGRAAVEERLSTEATDYCRDVTRDVAVRTSTCTNEIESQVGSAIYGGDSTVVASN